MATVVRSIGVMGIEGYPIAVQVKLLAEVVTMNIVGLGDQAVKEAKDRIESAFDHLRREFPKKKRFVYIPDDTPSFAFHKPSFVDFAEVAGHQQLLKNILVAAAGVHNLLLIGPPGCGKSMIAKRLPTILPDLSEEEALEVMA